MKDLRDVVLVQNIGEPIQQVVTFDNDLYFFTDGKIYVLRGSISRWQRFKAFVRRIFQ